MVPNLVTSVEFYRDHVGLEPAETNDGNVEVDAGECTLVLEEDFDREVLDAFGLGESDDERGRGVIVAVGVDSPEDVDAIRERAAEAGEPVRMDPTHVDWERRMALFADSTITRSRSPPRRGSSAPEPI